MQGASRAHIDMPCENGAPHTCACSIAQEPHRHASHSIDLPHLPTFRAGAQAQKPRARDQLRPAVRGLLSVEPSDKTDACLHKGSMLSYGPAQGAAGLWPHPTGPPCLVRAGPLHFIERCLYLPANLVPGQAPRPRRLRVCVAPSDSRCCACHVGVARANEDRYLRVFVCRRRWLKR